MCRIKKTTSVVVIGTPTLQGAGNLASLKNTVRFVFIRIITIFGNYNYVFLHHSVSVVFFLLSLLDNLSAPYSTRCIWFKIQWSLDEFLEFFDKSDRTENCIVTIETCNAMENNFFKDFETTSSRNKIERLKMALVTSLCLGCGCNEILRSLQIQGGWKIIVQPVILRLNNKEKKYDVKFFHPKTLFEKIEFEINERMSRFYFLIIIKK